MNFEDRKKYQAYATACMRNKTKVRYGSGLYLVGAIIYTLRDRTDEELFSVLLHDTKRLDSSITVGLAEFYKANQD